MSLAKPTDFRLVELLYKESEKIRRGWWSGYSWDGARLPPNEKPTHWRALHSEHFVKRL